MSNEFFDRWDQEVREAKIPADLPAIEATRVHVVNLVTGDREFPDDARELVQGLIAVLGVSVYLPSPMSLEGATTGGYSRLARELRTVFSEIAKAEIETRFGVLTDDPWQILIHRSTYDSDRFKGC